MHGNCAAFGGQSDWKETYVGSKILVLKMRVFGKERETKQMLWPIISRRSCSYRNRVDDSAGLVPERHGKRDRTREASCFHAAAIEVAADQCFCHEKGSSDLSGRENYDTLTGGKRISTG